MKTLRSIRLKANPAGKDRMRYGGASAAQLGAEWVDIKNEGGVAAPLNGLSLYHIAYSGATDNGKWDRVMGFTGNLGPGKVMRVHSGSGPESVLAAGDLQGADAHLFTKRDNYVWNNDRGDCSALWKDGESAAFDKACYDPAPPEGVTLVRVGDRLVAPSAARATTATRR